MVLKVEKFFTPLQIKKRVVIVEVFFFFLRSQPTSEGSNLFMNKTRIMIVNIYNVRMNSLHPY